MKRCFLCASFAAAIILTYISAAWAFGRMDSGDHEFRYFNYIFSPLIIFSVFVVLIKALAYQLKLRPVIWFCLHFLLCFLWAMIFKFEKPNGSIIAMLLWFPNHAVPWHSYFAMAALTIFSFIVIGAFEWKSFQKASDGKITTYMKIAIILANILYSTGLAVITDIVGPVYD